MTTEISKEVFKGIESLAGKIVKKKKRGKKRKRKKWKPDNKKNWLTFTIISDF